MKGNDTMVLCTRPQALGRVGYVSCAVIGCGLLSGSFEPVCLYLSVIALSAFREEGCFSVLQSVTFVTVSLSLIRFCTTRSGLVPVHLVFSNRH